MGFKELTPMREIEKYTIDKFKKLNNSIITSLMYIGDQCVNEARDNGSYTDQTGNLRSSIGYVVVQDGRVVSPVVFTQVKQGAKGARKGKEYIEKLASQYKNGYALIVVAGMKYAAHVEARGKNVLSSSELKAENITPRIMKKLGLK